MSESRIKLGFGLSVSAHAAVVVIGVFAGQIFQPDEEPPLTIVDAALVTAEQFDQLARNAAQDEAPEQEAAPPEPALAAIEPPSEEEPEPEIEPEPELADEPPEPEEPPTDDAPVIETPPQPMVAAAALQAESGVKELREALPAPQITEAASLEQPEQEDQQPETPVDSAAPAEEESEVADLAPPTAPPPPQPRARNRDESPKPEEPDDPPEPQQQAQEQEQPPQEEPPEEQEAPTEVAAVEPPKAPEYVAPQTAIKPRRRPNIPEPRREPEQDPLANIETLLNNDRGGAARVVARAPVSFAPRTGTPLTGAEIDGLRLHLRRCWNPPLLGGEDPRTLTVAVYMKLRIDGRIEGQPLLARPQVLTTTRQEAAFRKAVNALVECEPYDQLPQSKFGQWRELIVTFDPERPLAIQ